MFDLKNLYQEVIVDHNRSPRNFHEMPDATCHAEGFNPLCGDKLKLYLQIQNGVIIAASFQGEGCAISTASASLMTEGLIGKTEQQAHELFNKVHVMLTGGDGDDPALGKLAVLNGVNEFPTRVKCASLAWHTLEAALEHQEQPVTTEET